MSNVNVTSREVAAKIVFYGPGLSGKTTTLRRIHESVRTDQRGEMMSLATEGDRTLFFDFLPVKIERVGEYAVRLALYTVPGQVFYNSTRKLVLQGADGVVFVADSQPDAMDSNKESLQNLEENLLEQGIRLERFPLVLQYNKQDLPGVLSAAQLRRELNRRSVPDFETCATAGKGVLDGLKAITRLVIRDLRAKRIVPSPKSASPAPIAALESGAGPFQDQVQQQLDQAPAGPGLLAAICPPELQALAQTAESAYAGADYPGCVKSCEEAVRRVLARTGEASLPAQAYFLRVDGADLSRLQGLAKNGAPQKAEAAFALYVALQAMVRLAQTG